MDGDDPMRTRAGEFLIHLAALVISFTLDDTLF